MNNLRKKLITALLLTLLCAAMSAHGGMLSGEKKLRVVKTQWFDIIYPERCEASAAILYEKADGVYEEVTAQYGLTPAFRMPVVITPAVDQFNAFWTAVPYNHIAIYDTGSSGSSELAVFSETLLSTFRHELTHAVTFNMKNGFWRAMGKVFGDEFAPGMLAVTTGMAEGATVASESAAGEGRLNDEYAKHYVKQAKIEDQFPAYHDVSGASDVSPGGNPYYFNGAFHGWLQEKYGLEPYAEFWYRVVNGKNFTIAGAFKKSFGVKLRTAWKQFVAEYEVPAVAANPVKAGVAQDFFEPSLADYSNLNNAGSLYESLSSDGAAKKLIWLDCFGGRVFMADIATDAASHTQPRELFSQRGLTAARLSNDGRFIAVSYLTDNSPTIQARVKIYDLENRSFFSVKERGLKEAAILECGGEYYLIAQKYMAQRYSIAVYKIGVSGAAPAKAGVKAGGGRITSVEPYSELVLGVETTPYAFTPLEGGGAGSSGGRFAWLKKERLNYSLCVSAPDGTLLSEFAFPKGMVVRSLSAARGAAVAENSFLFSYAGKGTLPRLGSLELDADGKGGAKLSLSETDISGGVFEPVFWKGKIVYVGEFYRQNRLLCLEAAAGGEGEADALRDVGESRGDDDGALGEPGNFNEGALAGDLNKLSTPYNPFSYLYRGILIPISRYETDNIGPDASESSDSGSFITGITYITGLPWTSGSTGLYTLTSGYDFESNSVGLSFMVNEGMDTSLFQTSTEVKSEFNSDGWKQGGGTFDFSTSFAFGSFSKITLSNTVSGLIGRDLKQDEKLFYNIEDIVSLTYSNARKAGPGRFENKGFSLTVSYGGRKDQTITGEPETYVDISALTGGVKLYIPHLLPFESKYGFTYNLPLTIAAGILPISSIYGYASFGYDENGNSAEINKNAKNQLGRVVFDAKAEVVAFSLDIQKAIPGVTAVYLNDFYVTAGYAATGTAGSANYGGFQTSKLGEYFKAVADGRGYYLDSVYVKTALEFTPNIGVFAKSAYKMSLYSVYSYTINSIRQLKPEERIKLGLGFDMNF